MIDSANNASPIDYEWEALIKKPRFTTALPEKIEHALGL